MRSLSPMMRVSDVFPWLAALLLSDGANDMVSDECVACCGSGVAVAWQCRGSDAAVTWHDSPAGLRPLMWRVMTWQ